MPAPVLSADTVHLGDQLGHRFAAMLEQLGIHSSAWTPALRRLVDMTVPGWWGSAVGARAVQVACACIARATRDPRVGLRIGDDAAFGARSVIDYLVRSAPTLRHAFEVGQRFRGLAFDYVTLTLREDGPYYSVELTPDAGLELHPVNEDFRLAILVRITRALSGDGSLTPHELAFTYPRPSNTQPYYDRYGKQLQLSFGVKKAHVVFARHILDRECVFRDDLLHALMLRQAEDFAARIAQSRGTVAERLYDVVAQQLQTGKPNSAAAARKLGVSERTLRRRLADEGESFQGVVDRVRASLAQAYLQNPQQSIESTAQKLGFDSSGSLRRAFQRWTGTPLRAQRPTAG